MRYTAVFFDMDGTVLDTLEDLTEAANHSLAHFGYPVRSREEIRLALGQGARHLIRETAPADLEPEALEALLDYYKVYYQAHSCIRTGPFPGIPELLAGLQERGIRVAVISNKPDPAVQLLGQRFFPGICCVGERPGIPIKPAPDGILRIMAQMGAEPRETLYVGDTENDMEAAARAGVDCLLVSYGFRSRAFLEGLGGLPVVDTAAEIGAYVLGE